MSLIEQKIFSFERLFNGIPLHFRESSTYGLWTESSNAWQFSFHPHANPKETFILHLTESEKPIYIHIPANTSIQLIEAPSEHLVPLHYQLEEKASLQQLCFRLKTHTEFDLQAQAQLTHLTYGVFKEAASHKTLIHLCGEHAVCNWQEIFVLSKNLSSSTQIDIEHEATHTKASCAVRTCLQDAAQFRFVGNLTAHPKAFYTNTSQTNLNYLLSPQARVQSDPNLHIYNKHAQAHHGSATQAIDMEALFYLQSRGLSEQQARTVFLSGFLRTAYQSLPPWKEALDTLLENIF